MLKRMLVGSILMSISIFVFGGKTSSAKIEQMMIDEDYGGLIFIRAVGEIQNAPECAANGQWSYVLPLNSELQKTTMTSFLLVAYTTGKAVQLIGKNSCNEFNSIETLKRIEFEP